MKISVACYNIFLNETLEVGNCVALVDKWTKLRLKIRINSTEFVSGYGQLPNRRNKLNENELRKMNKIIMATKMEYLSHKFY